MTYAINRNISEAFIPYYHSVSVVSAQVQLQKKCAHAANNWSGPLYLPFVV